MLNISNLESELHKVDSAIQDIFLHNQNADGLSMQHDKLRDLVATRKCILDTMIVVAAVEKDDLLEM